jgi:PH (Pleckstrin Homology) domain-containing protein
LTAGHDRGTAASPAAGAAGEAPARQTFRSPFAMVIWWLWVLFAAGNLIDLAVEGRDHLSVVAAFILLLITGVMQVTVHRPRIVADGEGLTIMNPLRDHRIGWAAVAGIDAAWQLRVRCEWPLDGGAGGTGHRVVYSWAIHSSRRKQVTAELRTQRRSRRGSARGSFGAFGTPENQAPPPPPTVEDTELVVSVLTGLAEQGRAMTPSQRAVPPLSSWYWPAFAVIVVPALALLIAVFA